ncbi:MAG: heme-binding protein, partial [Gammaproteobacteria bacterium]|nr:heme-binding protein [Gammaproteobacteria bacterium]
ASRITADGKTFRYSDARFDDLLTDPSSVPDFGSVNNIAGELVLVPGYYDGGNTDPAASPNDRVVLTGTAFGQPASGIRADTGEYPGRDAFVLVDAADNVVYLPIDGTDGAAAMTSDEVRALMSNALAVANRSRAQIRTPLGTPARVSISIVDSNGVALAIARTRDAPIFGTEVSLQKARTAAFFSSAVAASELQALPPAAYLDGGVELLNTVDIGAYVGAAQAFLDDPAALTNGAFAFSDRAGGNLSRPFYPDGVDNTEHGPFSKPAGFWSPFAIGLQLDLVYNAIIQHVAFVAGIAPDVGRGCAGLTGIDNAAPFTRPNPVTDLLANGIQIFPGSVPIYRGDTLIGGIGISGDGVDQDDMIAFLGLHEAGLETGTINNAPPAIRADNLLPRGTRLRFINCPQAPYINSDEQNVCENK